MARAPPSDEPTRPARSPLDVVRRFWLKCRRVGACIVFTGAKTRSGYGVVAVRLARGRWKNVPAHRFVYEIAHGPLPREMKVHHLCGNRACVRLVHLQALTAGAHTLVEDNAGARNLLKLSCPRGHPLAGDNLRIAKRGNGRGFRSCRACERERNRRFSAGPKGKAAQRRYRQRNRVKLRTRGREW